MAGRPTVPTEIPLEALRDAPRPRSPESVKRAYLAVLVLAILLAALWGAWYFGLIG